MSGIQGRASAGTSARMAERYSSFASAGKIRRSILVRKNSVPHRPLLASIACAAALCLLPLAANANTAEATSSRSARDEAVRAIPWRQIPAEHRRAMQYIVKNASIYRRLPTRVIDCDPNMFNFLLQHPEVVIDVWRVMGISQVTLQRVADGSYRCSDGAGTTGTVRFLLSQSGQDAQNVAVVLADGTYEGKPFPTPLKARSIIFLRSGAVRETNGRHYVTVRIDSFVRIEQMGIELVAKTVQPWISKTADRNFIETLTFVSNFSRTAEKNPQGMQRLATRLASIDEPTRKELVAVCFRTAERYAQQRTQGDNEDQLLAHRSDASAKSAQ